MDEQELDLAIILMGGGGGRHEVRGREKPEEEMWKMDITYMFYIFVWGSLDRISKDQLRVRDPKSVRMARNELVLNFINKVPLQAKRLFMF